jgi:hypothetical protein
MKGRREFKVPLPRHDLVPTLLGKAPGPPSAQEWTSKCEQPLHLHTCIQEGTLRTTVLKDRTAVILALEADDKYMVPC